jgi:hypothetical protein
MSADVNRGGDLGDMVDDSGDESLSEDETSKDR